MTDKKSRSDWRTIRWPSRELEDFIPRPLRPAPSDQTLALQHSLPLLATPVRVTSSYRVVGVDYSRAPDQTAHLFTGRQVGKTERERQRMRAALAAGHRVFATAGGRTVQVRLGPQGELLADPADQLDGKRGTITLDEWRGR